VVGLHVDTTAHFASCCCSRMCCTCAGDGAAAAAAATAGKEREELMVTSVDSDVDTHLALYQVSVIDNTL